MMNRSPLGMRSVYAFSSRVVHGFPSYQLPETGSDSVHSSRNDLLCRTCLLAGIITSPLFLRPDPRNEERHLSTISTTFLAENAFAIPPLAHRHNPVERHRIEQGRHSEHT